MNAFSVEPSVAVTSTLIRRHTAARQGRDRRLEPTRARIAHRSCQRRGPAACHRASLPHLPSQALVQGGHLQDQASSPLAPHPHPLACQHESSDAAEEAGKEGIEGKGPHEQGIDKLQWGRKGLEWQLPSTQAPAVLYPLLLTHTWRAAAASASAEKLSSTCGFGAGTSVAPLCRPTSLDRRP